MPHIATRDGTRLYYEEAATGTPVIFVHKYAGDFRTWEPQMRHFSRLHRWITYSQRGYLPSDVPTDGASYGQDIARDDVIALLDALKIDKSHVVGHSMGAATALHVGIHYSKRCISVVAAGCGYSSSPDPKKVEEVRALSRETGKAFAADGIAVAAPRYADGATRQTQKNKGPRGFAEFAKMLGEHSAEGHALTMLHLQAKRPTLWEMEADLKKLSMPLLVIVGGRGRLVSRWQRIPQTHRSHRRPAGDTAFGAHYHQRGTGSVQCGARRTVRRFGSWALAGTQIKSINLAGVSRWTSNSKARPRW